ncbi:RNA-binding protein 7-like isoform X2 [Varroa jacobsoni]|uniref:RRM domain-containing protein n=1 Tax=Varroa destructor TaxID=109461 RepID=A0A7M7KBL3_VARDE|nr:RNA-binding protein 7-like [Varroa destructor]XP_022710144.1 RNA-binding protein 7-like isoform X2 [Varroa jacobsoni]
MSTEARTLWVGNLSDNIDEDLLYELFVQAGPLENVNVKRGPGNSNQNPFAFVTFRHDASVGYAIALFDGISLYGRVLNMKQRHGVTPDYKYRDIMESYLQEMHHSRGRQQQQQQQPLMNYGNQLEQQGIHYAMIQQQMMMIKQQQHYDSGGNNGGTRGGFRRDQRDGGQARDNLRGIHGGHSHDRYERSSGSRRQQHHGAHHGSKHHHHNHSR